MATYTHATSVHKTLAAGVADTVTISGTRVDALEISNRSTTDSIYYRTDGGTAVAEASGNFYIGPMQTVVVPYPGNIDSVSIISTAAAPYSVQAIRE